MKTKTVITKQTIKTEMKQTPFGQASVVVDTRRTDTDMPNGTTEIDITTKTTKTYGRDVGSITETTGKIIKTFSEYTYTGMTGTATQKYTADKLRDETGGKIVEYRDISWSTKQTVGSETGTVVCKVINSDTQLHESIDVMNLESEEAIELFINKLFY